MWYCAIWVVNILTNFITYHYSFETNFHLNYLKKIGHFVLKQLLVNYFSDPKRVVRGSAITGNLVVDERDSR